MDELLMEVVENPQEEPVVKKGKSRKPKNEGEKKERVKRVIALKPSQVINTKRVVYDFEGEFLRVFGKPERIAKYFITGRSFSGKSSMVYILCEYYCKFGNVDYNSFEEGNSKTTSQKLERHGLLAHDDKFKLLPKLHIDEWDKRLSKKRSAAIGVFDSIQHGGLNKKRYDEFVTKFTHHKRGKSFMFISHNVKNDLTLHVRHDCDIKIDVIGFVARVESRYSTDGICHFLIWEKGAKEYWGKKYNQVIAGKYWPGQKK